MSFEAALRASELLLAFALAQQSLEQFRAAPAIFALRLAMCGLLAAGVHTGIACLTLLGLGMVLLYRFDGPYNGGSDRLGLLILLCLSGALLLPDPMRELALGYLAMQLILSYFISGWVKLVNPDWRSGRALRDVFAFSAYPVSHDLRDLAERPVLLRRASRMVIWFELAFPFFLLTPQALWLGLSIAAVFHLANAFLFGLNRFFWTWIAAYPSLLWLQDRVVGG